MCGNEAIPFKTFTILLATASVRAFCGTRAWSRLVWVSGRTAEGACSGKFTQILPEPNAKELSLSLWIMTFLLSSLSISKLLSWTLWALYAGLSNPGQSERNLWPAICSRLAKFAFISVIYRTEIIDFQSGQLVFNSSISSISFASSEVRNRSKRLQANKCTIDSVLISSVLNQNFWSKGRMLLLGSSLVVRSRLSCMSISSQFSPLTAFTLILSRVWLVCPNKLVSACSSIVHWLQSKNLENKFNFDDLFFSSIFANFS